MLLAVGISAFAQESVGIGKWRTHMPYHDVINVELLGSKVYAATPYELFIYDKDDNSLQILNKINGLSDIGISTIRRNEKLDVLVVAYTNANVDLIDNQGDINDSPKHCPASHRPCGRNLRGAAAALQKPCD